MFGVFACTRIPLDSNSRLRALPSICFFACERDSTLPAPWHEDANALLLGMPSKSQDPVPMSPGTRTGCPGIALAALFCEPYKYTFRREYDALRPLQYCGLRRTIILFPHPFQRLMSV